MIKPLSVIVLAVLVAGGAALYMSKQSNQVSETSASTSPATPSAPAPAGGGHMRGPQNAQVTLVEFGDYQCPSCGYYAPIVLEVLHRFPTQVKLEFHHYPLVALHQWAMSAALAAEAASDQGKFWEMHDLLYQNQDKWSRSQNAEVEFMAYANQLGLNANQFMQSMHSPDVQQRILQDVVRARDANINETPTFYLNGQKMVARPASADEFSKLVQEALPK